MSLPLDLQKRREELYLAFCDVQDSWKKYRDGVIPEDSAFAKKIMIFVVDMLSYFETHYPQIDRDLWTQFIHNFPMEFYYGEQGDDENYLAFDEFNLFDFFVEQWNNDEEGSVPSLDKIKKLKKELKEGLAEF
ncbi:MAG TPA: hypothetical protein VJJ82_01395 [Candidatus Nanoarchaeia archaeon]|nr:hypothetical protein [Candidatus Nanoarchaeia archaeon]